MRLVRRGLECAPVREDCSGSTCLRAADRTAKNGCREVSEWQDEGRRSLPHGHDDGDDEEEEARPAAQALVTLLPSNKSGLRDDLQWAGWPLARVRLIPLCSRSSGGRPKLGYR